MPVYSSRYKQLHDIEWFFECCGVRFHAVSNCGEIPANIDRDVNTRIQFNMEDTPDLTDDEGVYVNEGYVRYRMDVLGNNREGAFEDYVYGFKRMARKGFFSFDRDITQGEESRRYVLIAGPKRRGLQERMIIQDIPMLIDGRDIMAFEHYCRDRENYFIYCGFEVL